MSMDALRLMLVDDEPLANLRMKRLIDDGAWPGAEVVATAGSATEALHLLSRQPVDVLLMDIHMPGMDGLALARRLREAPQPSAVIFITAHAEHALQAFELDAVDYLTKPVRLSRLQDALTRASTRLGRQVPVAASPAAAAEPAMLVVSDRGRVLRIPVDEVVYLRAEMKYVTLRTTRHSYVLDDALSDLEQRLGEAVVRIHRNALVAKAAVRALERRAMPSDDGDDGPDAWAVRLAPTDDWLAVSRRQLAAVRQALAEEGL
ncbi:LytR/AlgR family response regulator transcription factor [Ideonella margarita]|uniref:LytTR family DNA-binding domain-containing protein n=1 Tax=Ideonella margarita TaxID=2984191 RepID=A0ABU9C0D9_9BURK